MITFLKRLASAIPTPGTSKVTLFVDSDTGQPSYKDNAGVVGDFMGPQGEIGPDPYDMPVTSVTTDYTVLAADRIIVVDSATDCALTFAAGLTQPTVEVWSIGAGLVTLVEDGGLTITMPEGESRTISLGAACSLRNFGADEWRSVGKMEPV